MTKRKKKTFWIITLKLRFLGTCNIQICTDYICSKAQELIFSHLDIQAVRLITSSSYYVYSDRYVIITLSLPILLSKTLNAITLFEPILTHQHAYYIQLTKSSLYSAMGYRPILNFEAKMCDKVYMLTQMQKKTTKKTHKKKRCEQLWGNCSAYIVTKLVLEKKKMSWMSQSWVKPNF